MTDETQHEITLTGLDGSNPLAFLAAVGTLRAVAVHQGRSAVKMAWKQSSGAWRPVLLTNSSVDELITSTLLPQCRSARQHPTLNIADNLTVSAEQWHQHVFALAEHATSIEETSFAAALASDAIPVDNGQLADTALRTMSGAGHQHFLKTMREILAQVNESHIRRALFEPWDYADPLRGLSLRLDPLDDKRYALQWQDPSGDPSRSRQGNMIGANALAILGIPLLKVAPVRGELQTTGFRGRQSRDCFWTWPIWTVWLSYEVVSTVLALATVAARPTDHKDLIQRGVAALCRTQRITTGKFRNFTPAEFV